LLWPWLLSVSKKRERKSKIELTTLHFLCNLQIGPIS
jgi:hypothetical protein